MLCVGKSLYSLLTILPMRCQFSAFLSMRLDSLETPSFPDYTTRSHQCSEAGLLPEGLSSGSKVSIGVGLLFSNRYPRNGGEKTNFGLDNQKLAKSKTKHLPPSIRTRISGSQWRLPPSPCPRPHPWGSVGTIQMVLVMAEGGQWGEAIPYWPRVFPGALDGTHSTAHQAESTVGT